MAGYAAGDVLKVAISADGKVRYYRNATLLHTNAAAPVYPLRLDASVFTGGSSINAAYICTR